eukprot:scaffold3351_cov127-Skeletonema_marinoi.AAC.2
MKKVLWRTVEAVLCLGDPPTISTGLKQPAFLELRRTPAVTSLESPYPPLRIGPTASKSLREWGGTQKRRKINNFN